MHTYIHIYTRKSKVDNRSRRKPEESFFNSYYMRDIEIGTTVLPGLVHFTLDPYFKVFSKAASNTIFWVFLWLKLWLNPRLQDHWQTLYPLDPVFIYTPVCPFLSTILLSMSACYIYLSIYLSIYPFLNYLPINSNLSNSSNIEGRSYQSIPWSSILNSLPLAKL